MNFAKLNKSQMDWLLTHEFETRGIITSIEIRLVKDVFNLDNLDIEGIRAVRNTVVCVTSNLKTGCREAGDWNTFDRINDTMSGVTAVMDMYIYQN